MTGLRFSGAWLMVRFNKIRGYILRIGLVRFIMRVMGEMSQDDGTNMAAGVAYYAFLSLFPLILGVISLLGLFLPSQTVQAQIFDFIQENFPAARDALENNINQVIELRGALGIIGIIGLLWSGSGILSAAGHAINRAWDIRQEMQFYFKKPRDIGLTIGLGILFFISIGASTAINFIPADGISFAREAIVQVLIRVTAFLLAFLVFLIIFKVIPNTRTQWRHIWPGALLTAILFEIGRAAFIFYLNNFGNYTLVYGTIGSIIALLVWIYYSSIIVILGAETTAEYSRMRRGIKRVIIST